MANNPNNDMTIKSNYTMIDNDPMAASSNNMMAASNNDIEASNNDMMANNTNNNMAATTT